MSSTPAVHHDATESSVPGNFDSDSGISNGEGLSGHDIRIGNETEHDDDDDILSRPKWFHLYVIMFSSEQCDGTDNTHHHHMEVALETNTELEEWHVFEATTGKNVRTTPNPRRRIDGPDRYPPNRTFHFITKIGSRHWASVVATCSSKIVHHNLEENNENLQQLEPCWSHVLGTVASLYHDGVLDEGNLR